MVKFKPVHFHSIIPPLFKNHPIPSPNSNMTTLALKLSLDGNNSTIRGTVLQNGEKVFSVYDFMTMTCQYKSKLNIASKVFYRLIADGSEYKLEILSLCKYHKFNGMGQRVTPVMTIKGLQRLLMILGGKVAKVFRDEALLILQRYLDGDTSLCEEINDNKRVGPEKSYERFTSKVLTQAYEEIIKESLVMPEVKYIYATKSEAFPGLIKIGRAQDVEARLAQLNTGCAPLPHKVVAVVKTYNYVRDENIAHGFFAHKRREREFFEVTIEEVRSFFRNHILPQFMDEDAYYEALLCD